MALVNYPVYRQRSIPHGDRAAAASAMSVPKLFLDTLLVPGAEWAFPAMSTAAVVNFDAIRVFGDRIVLPRVFVPAKREGWALRRTA